MLSPGHECQYGSPLHLPPFTQDCVLPEKGLLTVVTLALRAGVVFMPELPLWPLEWTLIFVISGSRLWMVGETELAVGGKQLWTSKKEGRWQALASVRRVTRLVSMSSRTERGTEEGINKTSSGTTVTVSGFLWNLEARRNMVKEVADLVEMNTGLLATALVDPMVTRGSP